MNSVFNYKLLANNQCIGHHISFPDLPELNVVYQAFENRLCSTRYGSSGPKCFWEGDLEITLNINGHIITINDHDKKQHKVTPFDLKRAIDYQQGIGQLIVGNTYLIQGIGVEIADNNRNQTYLKFIIVKQPISGGPVQIGPWETISDPRITPL